MSVRPFAQHVQNGLVPLTPAGSRHQKEVSRSQTRIRRFEATVLHHQRITLSSCSCPGASSRPCTPCSPTNPIPNAATAGAAIAAVAPTPTAVPAAASPTSPPPVAIPVTMAVGPARCHPCRGGLLVVLRSVVLVFQGVSPNQAQWSPRQAAGKIALAGRPA